MSKNKYNLAIYIAAIVPRTTNKNYLIIQDGLCDALAFDRLMYKNPAIDITTILPLFYKEDKKTLMEMLRSPDEDTILLAGQIVYDRWMTTRDITI